MSPRELPGFAVWTLDPRAGRPVRPAVATREEEKG
jgi:hypothetical protein